MQHHSKSSLKEVMEGSLAAAVVEGNPSATQNLDDIGRRAKTDNRISSAAVSSALASNELCGPSNDVPLEFAGGSPGYADPDMLPPVEPPQENDDDSAPNTRYDSDADRSGLLFFILQAMRAKFSGKTVWSLCKSLAPGIEV